MIVRTSRLNPLLAACLPLMAVACGGDGPDRTRPAPAPADSTAPATQARPDARGVITYPDYQIAIARRGDTVATIGQRIGVPVAELASYNGLPSNWAAQEGDTLVIPPSARVEPERVASDNSSWSPDLVANAIDSAPAETTDDRPPAETATAELAPGTEPRAEDLPPSVAERSREPSQRDPLNHLVEPGETIYSIARLYNVEVSAIAAWNGLGQDYTLRPGQSIAIPLRDTSPPAANLPGTTQEAKAPPSTSDPLPANPPSAEIPKSPQLSRYRSTTDNPARLLTPVNGPVVRPYVPSGPGRNDGIDIAVEGGTPVLAADTGEVALISNSLGSLGKIVLIRHPGGLTTVYGRVDGVTVRRGESVTRGQVIGIVAQTANSTLHFEVRKGAESVDPAGYL